MPATAESQSIRAAKVGSSSQGVRKPGVFTRPILEGLGILECFDAIVGGGDCPGLKPDPEPLRFAAARIGRV